MSARPRLTIPDIDQVATSPLEVGSGARAGQALPSCPAPVEPLLVPAAVAGAMCGRSEASWWRDHAAKRVPAPIRLGGSTLWRLQELRDWVAQGCPPRREWEARQGRAPARASRNGTTPTIST